MNEPRRYRVRLDIEFQAAPDEAAKMRSSIAELRPLLELLGIRVLASRTIEAWVLELTEAIAIEPMKRPARPSLPGGLPVQAGRSNRHRG